MNDSKQSRWSRGTGGVIVGLVLLIAYVASMGPVYRLVFDDPDRLAGTSVVYLPLVYVMDSPVTPKWIRSSFRTCVLWWLDGTKFFKRTGVARAVPAGSASADGGGMAPVVKTAPAGAEKTEGR